MTVSTVHIYISISVAVSTGNPDMTIKSSVRICMISIRHIATIVEAVLSFPQMLAAMTIFFSLLAAKSLMPETANSLAIISATAHAGA